MIKICFFAQIRELIGCAEISFSITEQLTIEQLCHHLSQRGDNWALALNNATLLAAVNHEFVDFSYAIKSGDEIAFFPPVTGG